MVEGTPGSDQTRARRTTGTARLNSKRDYRARKEGPVLSVEHAGDYLDVSRWTVYRLIERGELRAFKVGNRLRIAQSDLDEYIGRVSA